jgi:Tfp pilus assembly protein PilF
MQPKVEVGRNIPFWRRRWFIGLAILGVLGGAAGVWMLLHPAAFWLAPWRPQATLVGTRFIFGPYPVEADFDLLERQGVTTIISLLDADLPYEAVLLAQERERAAQRGMRVLNFPMKSILGQSFGKDYVASSNAAAQAARDSEGTVYIHCYLGLHRAERVLSLLGETRAVARYEGSIASERSPDRLALDRASVAYRAGRMEDVLRELATVSQKGVGTRLLEAWANYGLMRNETAEALFASIVAENPGQYDAVAGLGYCALRRNDLPEAERRFSTILAERPDDPAALEGLGQVRYRQNRPAEAKALLDRARQGVDVATDLQGKKTAGARQHEAWAAYRENRIEEAHRLFSELHQEDPQRLDPILGLGFCALRRNELDEAGARFSAVLERSADDVSALEGLGHVRYRQERLAEARALFDRVLAATPNNAEVRAIVSRIKAATSPPRPAS